MKTNRLAATLLAFAAPAIAAPLLWATPAAADDSSKLLRVVFQGNTLVPTADLQAAMPIQPGDPIDKAGIQSEMAAVQSVYKAHNVGAQISARTSIYPHGKGTAITFTLVEQAPQATTVTHVAPIADHVTASGNSRISTDKIIAASAIKPGDALTNEKMQAAQTAIVALYKKANIGSSVATDWTIPQPGHYDVVFKIVEKADD